MRKDDHDLLGDIEREVLDDGASLASALRKCVVLGGRANSATMRDWAFQELRGYPDAENLPPYRTVVAPILVDGVTPTMRLTGQRISPDQLPDVMHGHVDETVPLRIGIGEIEALISRTEGAGQNAVRLSLPGGANVARIMNHESGAPHQHIMDVYWSVNTAALHGVVDQVRTTLAELVAELRASMPPGQAIPTAEAAAQAVNVAIHGDRSRVTVTTAQASQQGRSIVRTTADNGKPAQGFWTRSRRVGAFIVGSATVIAAIVAVLQWLATR